MPSGRVVILSDYVGGEGAASGGAGHAAYDSYHALRRAGVDVRMVASFGEAPDGESDRFTSLHGRDLRAGGLFDMARTVYNAEAGRALDAALHGEDPATTLVILHQWTRYLSPAALAGIGRFATMVYMHDYFWACPNGAYYDFQQARPCDRQPMGWRCLAADCDRNGRIHKMGRVARQAVRDATARAGAERRLLLHLSTRAMRTAAPLLPRERHAILHNPLDLPEARPSSPGSPTFDVGYFGRLEPEKGVMPLIEALAGRGLTGLFMGQGALEAEIRRRPGLVHRRWAPRSSMAAAMRSCAAVVLPSLWHETWGLIVPEALAAGVKVLVSDRAGSAELVERFGGGAIFDPARPDDLGRRLEQLIAEPSRNLHDWRSFRGELSPERHARQIVALAAEHFGINLSTRREPASVPLASALQ